MDNIITNADGVKVKVRVYDFGDEVADRYTIVYVNKNIKDGYGVVYFGKRVKDIDSLPKKVIEFIKYITQ